MVADGNFLPITHVVFTNLSVSTSIIPLNDIVVCPSIKKLLLSFSKLCEDYLCGVLFDAQKSLHSGSQNNEGSDKGSKA